MSTLTLDQADRALMKRLGLAADCHHSTPRRVLLPTVEITAVADLAGACRNFPTTTAAEFALSTGKVPTKTREIYRFRNLLGPPNLCPRSTNGIQRPNTNPKLNEAKGETS